MLVDMSNLEPDIGMSDWEGCAGCQYLLTLQTDYQLCTFLTCFRVIELASECLNPSESVLEVFDCEEVLGVGRW